MKDFNTSSHLPVAVWEQIFKHLTFDQLKQSRSTCQHWKSIIDGSPSLMSRFHLVFPPNYVVDRHSCRHLPTIPARSVSFEKCRISCVESWWTLVGANLIHLTVRDCQLSFPTLQRMLARTPKLERLDYLCGRYPAVCSISEGVVLERLTWLTVDNPNMDVLDAFGAMCPNLKSFGLLQQNDKKKVLKFLKAKKDSLREVELTTLAYSLNVLLQIKQLTGLNIEHEVTSDEILCIIGKGLPQLKRIVVKMTKNSVLEPSFLTTMPELEDLTIKSRNTCSKQKMDLSGFKNPKLKHLGLFYVELVGNSLEQYLSSSLNLNSAEFDSCHFETWKEIFSAIGQFKVLRRLKIMRTKVNENNSLIEVSNNLEIFNIIDCNISKESIELILKKFKEVNLY